ncbi:MAG: hypothetical protein MSA09_09035 [Lachnospiraceae bacterium]|nr:hypothetical protein [Lachnospiraceae bacterium]MCI7617837.1 hypothetical protein [Bacillota bacterium]
MIIEEYCRKNPRTKKAAFLSDMVDKSYDLEYEPSEWEMLHLAELIDRERNPELQEALEDLDDFMCI